MKWKIFLVYLIKLLFRCILKVRYRIEIRGLENLKRLDTGKGTLVIPNHVALIDPVILLTYLWGPLRMRPVAVDYVIKNPLWSPFMKLLGAVSFPDLLNGTNPLKLKRAQEALDHLIKGLRERETYLLYPSGELKSSAKERLRGSSAAHLLFKECPDTNAVLIRTTGLWGSSFSKALSGKTPNIGPVLFNGIKAILKGGLFFVPRRKVILEIEVNPEGFPLQSDRASFNESLENWYNRYPQETGMILEKEPLEMVRYSLFEKKGKLKAPSFKKRAAKRISDQTKETVFAELKRIAGNPNLEIKPDMALSYDLGFDSLNLADLTGFLLNSFEIKEIQPENMATVQDVLEICEGASSDLERSFGTFKWPAENNRPAPNMPEGQTIPESFLRACDRMGPSIAFGDDVAGPMSYQKMKRAILVLSRYFRTLPGDRIGVLLPASIGAFITSLAIQFAKKTPVMLNWTLGPHYLDEMVKISKISTVISSGRFLDRLSHIDFGSLVNQLQVLEEIRSELHLKMKLSGALLAKFSANRLERFLKLKEMKENDCALVLFTSGTEASPKCVPLTHKNILNNCRGSFEALEDLRPEDVLFATLPPFHSFGFICTGMLALLSGVKTAFYPDPTDSQAVLEGVHRWKVSLFPAPPSFIKRLFAIASDDELSSIRLYLSGAEKMAPELLERIHRFPHKAKLLEGYGITECSSTVALNRPSHPPKGVGRLLPDYDVCVIHPETGELLPSNTEGELCLRGPSVFEGYLNHSGGFIKLGQKRWYRTGDIGSLDEDGHIFISGRLKRFAKIGGEMISLGAVEEKLVEELSASLNISTDLPILAVCSNEKGDGTPGLVLFTKIPIEKEEANKLLKKAGFSNLIKIAAVHQIEEIPLLSTGKMDYRSLQSFLDK